MTSREMEKQKGFSTTLEQKSIYKHTDVETTMVDSQNLKVGK